MLGIQGSTAVFKFSIAVERERNGQIFFSRGGDIPFRYLVPVSRTAGDDLATEAKLVFQLGERAIYTERNAAVKRDVTGFSFSFLLGPYRPCCRISSRRPSIDLL